MRVAVFICIGLVFFVTEPAEGQGVACFALEFPDSAPAFPEGLTRDTIVLSDITLGDLEDLMPGGRRAFLSLPEYRDPAPLTYRVEGWRAAGSDSVEIRPLLFMVALVWRAEITASGMEGEVQAVTDEVGAPQPTYRFRAAEVSCLPV